MADDPSDFPKKGAIRYCFDKWIDDSTLVYINDVLCKMVREQLKRDPEPSIGVLDSQSVKTTEVVGDCDFDGKKVVNHKRMQALSLVKAGPATPMEARREQPYREACEAHASFGRRKAQRPNHRIQPTPRCGPKIACILKVKSGESVFPIHRGGAADAGPLCFGWWKRLKLREVDGFEFHG